MLKNKKLGFIGGGNMAEALIKGLVSTSFFDSKNIFVSEPSKSKSSILQKKYKIKIIGDNRELGKKCDIIILAVKPQILKEVLCDIRSVVGSDKLMISVAAGVPIFIIDSVLRGESKKKFSVVRTMPNTPSLVQEGVTAISSGKYVSKADLKIAHKIFEAVGLTVDVEENQLERPQRDFG